MSIVPLCQSSSTYNDMITSSILNHVGYELCCNWSSTLILLVLSRIEEMRNDCSDPPCAGRLASVNHDEQFHERCIW